MKQKQNQSQNQNLNNIYSLLYVTKYWAQGKSGKQQIKHNFARTW